MSFPPTQDILAEFVQNDEVGEALELWADVQLLEGPGLTTAGNQMLLDRLGYLLRRIATTPIETDDYHEEQS